MILTRELTCKFMNAIYKSLNSSLPNLYNLPIGNLPKHRLGNEIEPIIELAFPTNIPTYCKTFWLSGPHIIHNTLKDMTVQYSIIKGTYNFIYIEDVCNYSVQLQLYLMSYLMQNYA